MKRVRKLIESLLGLLAVGALILALNSLFHSQVGQTGAAASPTLVTQTGATPPSTPKAPLSLSAITIARRYALRVEAPALTHVLNWVPVFSPDGNSMLIRKRGSTGEFELWRTDLNGQSALLLAKSQGDSPAWSPDGQQVAYIGRTPKGEASLQIVQADGKADRLITTDVINNSEVGWLNSRTVVYMDRAGRVIALHLDTNTSERLDPPEIGLPATGGRFIISPQKDRVVFSSASTTWLVALDTRQVSPMPPYVGGWDVAWSPDGNQVAFASESSIFLSNKNGTNLTEIRINPAWDPGWLAWSPDGRLLAFIAKAEDPSGIGNAEIFLLDVVQKQVMQLTKDGKGGYEEQKTMLVWSPDGTKLVYLSWPTDQTQVLELTPNDPRSLGRPLRQETPLPVVPSTIPTPQPSDCPYQQGNSGTIWIRLSLPDNVKPPHYQGELVQVPFEGNTQGTYLESVLEGELGGTEETPLSNWQSEAAKAVVVSSRTNVVDLCPGRRITDSVTSESHFGIADTNPVRYVPGHSAQRAQDYASYVAQTISQTLIYNGRIFAPQFRDYTGRQTHNADPNGPHKGIFDPVAAVDESSATGLGQHSANHWAMGLHNERLGQAVNVPNVQWYGYGRILVHYYTGVHIRDNSNNQLLTPNDRWNLLSESIPTRMGGGQSYPVPVVLQNTSISNWEANRYVLGYRWDWGPQIYAGQTTRPAVGIGQWITAIIPIDVLRGDRYAPTLRIEAPTVSYESDYILTVDIGRIQADGYSWFRDQTNPGWTGFTKFVHLVPGATPTPSPSPTSTPTPAPTTTPGPGWVAVEQTVLQDVPSQDRNSYSSLLSRARDQTMVHSQGGQLYVDLTYRYAPELAILMARNPSLRQRAQALMLQVRPGVEAFAGDHPASTWTASKELVAQADVFLKDLAAEASPALAAEIGWWRKRLPGWVGKTPQQMWGELLKEQRGLLVTP